jgi:hypothetical protein
VGLTKTTLSCPNCGRCTLDVYRVSASRWRERAAADTSCQRVECTAGCDVTDEQLLSIGLVPPRDRSAPLIQEARLPLGEDRCDDPYPQVLDMRCGLHVGHGGRHRGSTRGGEAVQWT